MSKNKLVSGFQSGFRKKYSTNTCLGHLTDKITTGFEKGLFTGMILSDLQKAFGTIDHQILVKKMKYLGFSKTQLQGSNPISVNGILRKPLTLVTPVLLTYYVAFLKDLF